MRLFKKTVGLVFWLSAVGWAATLIRHPSLPESKKVNKRITELPPVQEATNRETINLKRGKFDYEIIPLYTYDISGVVVAEYSSDNWLDFYHKRDPANTRDLCLVWGKSVENGTYRQVKYKHGEFTCYYQYGEEVYGQFDPTELSNNHLLPETDVIAGKIREAQTGDQVNIRGYLVEYTVRDNGEIVGTRGTSTTRTDMGNGSCETILVTGFEIIKNQNPWYILLKQNLPLAALAALGLSLILWFVPEREGKGKTRIIFD